VARRKPTEGSIRPQPAEALEPATVRLPARPTKGRRKGGEDRREEREPLPAGPFRAMKDLGEPTAVEGSSRDDDPTER
jgi:hypothetical protein